MNVTVRKQNERSSAVLALVAAAPVVSAAALGRLGTLPNIPGWYDGLAKPPLNPPNAVFGPVWTVLYVMMAIAFYRVLRLDSKTPGRSRAIVIFLIQLVLNMAWSFAFFGMRSPALGMLVVVALEALVVLTILLFARLDRIAAWLLWPYAAWVGFAAYLNAGVWRLNGG